MAPCASGTSAPTSVPELLGPPRSVASGSKVAAPVILATFSTLMILPPSLTPPPHTLMVPPPPLISDPMSCLMNVTLPVTLGLPELAPDGMFGAGCEGVKPGGGIPIPDGRRPAPFSSVGIA